MMTSSRGFLVAGVVVVALSGGAVSVVEAGEDAASVKGTLVANGTTVELPFVYAYAQDEGFYDPADPTWTLLFVEHAIEPRKLDDAIWDAAYVRLGITKTAEFGDAPELHILSQEIRFSAESGGNITGGTYPELELSSAGPERFAGRVYLPEQQEFFDDTFQYDFSFSAPLSDPSAPIGDLLPAGGGQPGAAYLAWTEAVHSGDLDRIRALVPPEQAELLEDTPEVREELEFMRQMTPAEVTIVSGSSDGETAILDVTGTIDGEAVTGEIVLLKMADRWIATETNWR